MLVKSGVGTEEDVRNAAEESHGLGVFVRTLVGLDRVAAKEALGAFISDKTLGASQIEFLNLIIDHLTEHGVMKPEMLYESPFTDITPHGPDGLFSSSALDQLLVAINRINQTALAA